MAMMRTIVPMKSEMNPIAQTFQTFFLQNSEQSSMSLRLQRSTR